LRRPELDLLEDAELVLQRHVQHASMSSCCERDRLAPARRRHTSTQPVLRKIQARWKNPPILWHAAKAQMAIQFEDRFVVTD